MGGRSSFLRNTAGAAGAEMALLLPLLMVMLFVTFEGGYFLWNQHKVVKGVRDGARYAARLDFSYFTACPATGGSLYDVPNPPSDSIKEITRTGKLSAGTAVVAGWDNAEVAVTCDYIASTGGLYGAFSNKGVRVKVKADVPYPSSPLTSLASVLGFDPSGLTLRAEAQASVIGL